MSHEVTVLMVPRERFSGIQSCIASLYEHTTDVPFRLLYVDGSLPHKVKEMVEAESRQRGFDFIHRDYPLTPNEARNIGLSAVDTPHVVFIDNDIVFRPNWLEPLLDTAKEYDAWLAGPTILDANFPEDHIHAAGGEAIFEIVDGKRRYHFRPGHRDVERSKAEPELKRGPVSMLEFHVMLARRDIFDTIGPLDERVLFFDHDDLVITVTEAGGLAVYEPASTITYHDPGTKIDVLEPNDLPQFLLRWSNEWNLPAIDHAVEKWRLDPEDPWIGHAQEWVRLRRRRCYRIAGLRGRAVGYTMHHISKSIGERMEKSFCDHYTHELFRARARMRPEKTSTLSVADPSAIV